ncbi:hypothetical protein LJR225_005140 [Phenylobacterium sp. LjRoot225]|uniref:hypothetical protein n=1 Tax=Phenylobacterium sp. LjRoot225 TaxID=3342285 RepID=UPI003ED03CAA
MTRTETEQKALGESFPTRHCRAMDRYITRPDRGGFTVFDVWTGEIAVIAMAPQQGLSIEDAEHTAELLNRRVRQGDRKVLQ